MKRFPGILIRTVLLLILMGLSWHAGIQCERLRHLETVIESDYDYCSGVLFPGIEEVHRDSFIMDNFIVYLEIGVDTNSVVYYVHERKLNLPE